MILIDKNVANVIVIQNFQNKSNETTSMIYSIN